MEVQTGTRKTIDAYQAWFKIGNQTFYLEEHVEDTDLESKEIAEFYEKMLRSAFEKL
jgi:L-arabinose isomerase